MDVLFGCLSTIHFVGIPSITYAATANVLAGCSSCRLECEGIESCPPTETESLFGGCDFCGLCQFLVARSEIREIHVCWLRKEIRDFSEILCFLE